MNKFAAAENGFPFSNDDLPPVPIVIDLPFGLHWKVTEANGGECGGMCAASLDYYFAGRKPPKLENPSNQGILKANRTLLDYLWQRQLDSLDIRLLPNGLPDLFHWPTVVVKFGERMGGPQRLGTGIADVSDATTCCRDCGHTKRDHVWHALGEWTCSKCKYCSGLFLGDFQPCVLGLVYHRSLDPAAMMECHQVVAREIATTGAIMLYDPDRPGDDGVFLQTINDGNVWCEVSCDGHYPVHSFFVIPYSRKEPPV